MSSASLQHVPDGSRQTSRRLRVVAWSLWDWGSAAFNAVMVTFVFGTYLSSEVFGPDGRGTSWLAAGNAVAGALIAVTAPVIGQRGDRGGKRTLWLGMNTALVVACMASCFFVQPQETYLVLGVILLSTGNVFFEYAEVHYNAMLVDISTPSTIGRISGIGWACGYLGGIVLLGLLYLGFISEGPHWFGVPDEQMLNIRIVAVIAAGWFLLFSLPVLFAQRRGVGADLTNSAESAQKNAHEPSPSVVESYRQLWGTLVRMWREDRNTLAFLISSAVFRDGTGAIFAYGAVLGTTVYGISASDVLLFGIGANVVAAIGAFSGGFLDDKLGPKWVIWISLAGLLALAGTIFFLDGAGAFWVGGLLLCFFVGPVQSASRGFLGRLVTPDTAGEIYGLYATTGPSVSFLSPALITLFVGIVGDSRAMIPAIMLVLLAGALLLIPVRDPKVTSRTL
ncbi:MFS transporter [Auritidibacter ignavus]|uniref:MFS transporter n=1 Tax=Auritidibacter ignavus TaxID=678932 RepID=UPI002FE6A3D0